MEYSELSSGGKRRVFLENIGATTLLVGIGAATGATLGVIFGVSKKIEHSLKYEDKEPNDKNDRLLESISPNGKYSAYFAKEGDGYTVKVTETATGNTTILRENVFKPNSRIAWTPESDLLAYVVQDEKNGNMMIRYKSLDRLDDYYPALPLLTGKGFVMTDPVFSEDGVLLYTVLNKGENAQSSIFYLRKNDLFNNNIGTRLKSEESVCNPGFDSNGKLTFDSGEKCAEFIKAHNIY